MGPICGRRDRAAAQGQLPRVRAADRRPGLRGSGPLLRDRNAHPPRWRSQPRRSALRHRQAAGADRRRDAGRGELDRRQTMNPPIDVVTGAFSYSGRFVAAQLLERGRDVRTLTNHPKPDDPLARRITAYPLDFENGDRLVAALTGGDTLYNTYWVRAPYGSLTHRVAVENTRRLTAPARRAGARRIVQPSTASRPASGRSYYAGK